MPKLSCGAKLAKLILFVFNAILWICGCAILAIGIWIKVDPTVVEYLKIINLDSSDPLLESAAILLIVVGVFVFGLGFLGCCGACQESSCMLCLYAGLLCIVVTLELVAAILAIVFNGKLGEELRSGMAKQVKTEVDDKPESTAITAAWYILQYEFKCCGSNDYKDYKGSHFAGMTGDQVPPTCCILSNNDPRNPKPRNYLQCNAEALTTPVTELYSQGCYEGLSSFLKDKSSILIGVGIAIAFVQIAGIFMACCIRNQINAQQG